MTTTKILDFICHSPQTLKKIFESLKEITAETNIELSKDSITISKVNTKNSICCKLQLLSAELNRDEQLYSCKFSAETPFVVGINLFNLSKIFKSIPNNKQVRISVDDSDKNLMKIEVSEVKPEENIEITTYGINFVELNEEKISFPPADYDATIEFSCKKFQKIIKDMVLLESKYVDIKFCNGQLSFSSVGSIMFRESTYECAKKNNIARAITTPSKDLFYIIKGRYDIKDLQNVCKFTLLSKTVRIMMKNDIPLVIWLNIENYGELTLVIVCVP